MQLPKLTLNEALKLHAERKLVGAFVMSNETYHAAPGISKSALDDIAVSPAYYKWKLSNPSTTSDALIFGSAYHARLLEPETFKGLFFETDTQPRVVKRDEQGRLPIGRINLDKIKGMLEVYSRNETALKLINGLREVSFFWTDKDTGVLCKCKPDVVIPSIGLVVDNKTAGDVSAETFSRDIFNYRYYVQGAFAIDGIKQAQEQTGDTFGIRQPESFVIVAQEKSEPYQIAMHQVCPQSLVKGEQHYRRDLETYARCVSEGRWPELNNGQIKELSIPQWALSRED